MKNCGCTRKNGNNPHLTSSPLSLFDCTYAEYMPKYIKQFIRYVNA